MSEALLSTGGTGGLLHAKIGPFPASVWVLVIGGGIGVGLWRKHKAAAAAASMPTTITLPTTAAVDQGVGYGYGGGGGGGGGGDTSAPPPVPAAPDVPPVPDTQPPPDPYAALKAQAAAIFDQLGVPIATSTETRDQRLQRIAMEVAGGQRSLYSGPNSVLSGVQWDAGQLSGAVPPARTTSNSGRIPPTTTPVKVAAR